MVTLWYTDLLPASEIHAVGNCVAFHQSKVLLNILRTVSVQLCQQLPGTIIFVNEAVYLSP